MTPSTSPSILVVDDDPDICRNLSDILADLGYYVDTALGGQAALDLVRRRPYDVALLDLKMPDMDGLTLYREIKKLQAGVVAIVVSAYASGAKTEEALATGAWHVLPKPVDLERLLRLVGEALDQPLVLVVDDDEDLCQSLWDVLRECGYRVYLAHDEHAAGESLRGKEFRVVLIDMKLPSGDGSGVFRLVRQSNPLARTILVTGHLSEMDRVIQQVQKEGADAVCYKPFDMPRLLELLEHLSQPATAASASTPSTGHG